MADRRVQRRLAAVLAADIAGYTRLMEADTDGTIAAWHAARSDVIDPGIARFRGRIVKHTGDGFLAEFSTAQDAVNCAIAVQKGLASSVLEFRMGINLGDIIDDGEDIHGEGVNVAARLEGLAEPGGICISGEAHALVRNRIETPFRDLGEHEVKHVTYPVRVFAIGLTSGTEKRDQPDPITKNKNSIAVLPFDNLSGDPEQAYFSDGMAEDLITDLSKVEGLFVAARNSSFSFRDQMLEIKDIASNLKVAHVLEGSVRKMGDRLRINVQLVDAADGGYVWAERYDGEMAEIFDFQDRIREEIVSALKLKLTPDEGQRSSQRQTSDAEAYDLYLRGRAAYYKYTPNNLSLSEDLLSQAIAADPNLAEAYAYLARCILSWWIQSWPGHDDDLSRALEMAERAVAIDDQSVLSIMMLAFVLNFNRNVERSFEQFELALSINPNSSEVYVTYAASCAFWGDQEKTLKLLKRAQEIDPVGHPNAEFTQGQYHYLVRQYDESIQSLTRVVERQPGFNPASLHLAAAYVAANRPDEAKAIIDNVLTQVPTYTMADAERIYPYVKVDDRVRFLNGLRTAGIPEA